MSNLSTETNVPQRSTHTPGPWKVVEHLPGQPPERGYIFISSEKSSGKDHWHGLAKVPCGWPGIADGIRNAKLIAAAPDLLQALQAAYLRLLTIGQYEGRHTADGQAELSAIRSAISSATGRSDQDVQDTAESIATELRYAKI